jgi:aldehyde dehydrogenase (NAD+)
VRGAPRGAHQKAIEKRPARCSARPLTRALPLSASKLFTDLPLNSIVAAVSAGNTVVLKPSELASASEALLSNLLARYMDTDAVRVVRGGVPEATELLAQRFDCIMYTGGPAVARVVMAAAARHLTPVLLELGGKNPVIVDASADINAAAVAILRGRFTNAGQICIAPEYVLVEASVEAALVERLRVNAAAMYGAEPRASGSYGRLISAAHWKRVVKLIEGAGGATVCGGAAGADEAARFIPPTVIREPAAGAGIWREEVFGPVLCTRRVESVEEAIRIVNAGEKPLCLYVFSSNSANIAGILARTSAGGVTVNDTTLHATGVNPELPFGGVGLSGMGAYHGRAGFEAFSHRKPVFRTYAWFNVLGAFINPPYYKGQERTLALLLRYAPTHLLPVSVKDAALVGLLAAVVAMGLKIAGKY